jgi:hypothetical protein
MQQTIGPLAAKEIGVPAPLAPFTIGVFLLGAAFSTVNLFCRCFQLYSRSHQENSFGAAGDIWVSQPDVLVKF